MMGFIFFLLKTGQNCDLNICCQLDSRGYIFSFFHFRLPVHLVGILLEYRYGL